MVSLLDRRRRERPGASAESGEWALVPGRDRILEMTFSMRWPQDGIDYPIADPAVMVSYVTTLLFHAMTNHPAQRSERVPY
jgi:hypothetical protein